MRERPIAGSGRGHAYAVTAYTATNALGVGNAAVARALYDGASGLRPCPLDVPFETLAGAISAPLPVLPATLRSFGTRMIGVALLALEEIRPAVARVVARYGAERVALALGTSTGGIAETEAALDTYRRTGVFPPSYDYQRQHPFYAFSEVIADATGARGPRVVVSTACSSSAKVLGCARRYLHQGVADAVLVGGVDTLCHTTVRGFHSLGALAAGPCRPFGVDRPGMNVGEGGAFLVIERDVEGPAYLAGIGESSDAHHMSAPDPEGRGIRLAMTRALDDARLAPGDVDHVNAHGTGTERNDVTEAAAIADVIGTRVPVVSTKAYTGHLLGAGGATEAVFALMALEAQRVPKSLGADPLDPEILIDVALTARDVRMDVVMSNSFAFGGNNVALVFARRPPSAS